MVLAALVLGGCAYLTPSRAQLTVTFEGATPEVLRAAALVLSERLREAGVPVVDSQATADGVVFRLGLDATDSDLEVARAGCQLLVEFRVPAGHRSVEQRRRL